MTIFEKRLFGSWRPDKQRFQTNVTPKKGMLVSKEREWLDHEWYGYEKPEHFLIVYVVVDEYGHCKFEYLGNERTFWSKWMTIREFNKNWRIKNPWA